MSELSLKSNQHPGLYEEIQTAVEYIRSTGYKGTPSTAIIFGSGLGAMAAGLDIEHEIVYGDIPGFVKTTNSFHKGRLLFGKISGKDVVAQDGRFHYYEGYTMQQISFPTRVMNALGAKKLIASNICGGVNPNFHAGDIIVMSDHINMIGDNPLIGPNDDRLGVRFPDLSDCYSKRLIALAEKQARKLNIHLQKGVYLVLSGPTFETRAEYRMARMMGADMVGMSTVPEVLAGIHGGMECLGFSLISDECFPECLQVALLEDLLERAHTGSVTMGSIIAAILADPDYLK
jgi:purine-nucleoside phosphorylase